MAWSGKDIRVALRYENLDETTRAFMLAEFDMDSHAGRVYACKRMTDAGQRQFPALLREAIREQDDSLLAEQLHDRFRDAMPVGASSECAAMEAPGLLAEGEFNRYYMRGLCARAVDEGIAQVQVYRARVVSALRRSLLQCIGERHAPGPLLRDLHATHCSDPASVSPFGVNTGLTLRLV